MTGGGPTGGASLIGIKADSKIQDLLTAATEKDDDDGFGGGGGGGKTKKKSSIPLTDFDVLKVAVLLKLTTDTAADSDRTKGSASRCIINAASKRTRIPLQLDSLAVLHRTTPAIALYDILIESVCRSIRMIERSIVEQKYLQRIDDMGVPKTYTFVPNGVGHFFSAVYFSKCSDDGKRGRINFCTLIQNTCIYFDARR